MLLAAALLERWSRQAGAEAAYESWVTHARRHHLPPNVGHVLAEATLTDESRYRLMARPAAGEFVLVAEHPEFELALGVVQDVEARPAVELLAACVARFEGSPVLAARWARAARQAVQGARLELDPAPRERSAGQRSERAEPDLPLGGLPAPSWGSRSPAKC